MPKTGISVNPWVVVADHLLRLGTWQMLECHQWATVASHTMVVIALRHVELHTLLSALVVHRAVFLVQVIHPERTGIIVTTAAHHLGQQLARTVLAPNPTRTGTLPAEVTHKWRITEAPLGAAQAVGHQQQRLATDSVVDQAVEAVADQDRCCRLGRKGLAVDSL